MRHHTALLLNSDLAVHQVREKSLSFVLQIDSKLASLTHEGDSVALEFSSYAR